MLGLHIRRYGATHDYLVSILSPIQTCGLDTGITTLSDVVYQGHLNTYDNLRSRRDLPNHFFFKGIFNYATPSRLNSHPLYVWRCLLWKVCLDPLGGKTLSNLYNILATHDTSKVSQLFSSRKQDIPTLAGND